MKTIDKGVFFGQFLLSVGAFSFQQTSKMHFFSCYLSTTVGLEGLRNFLLPEMVGFADFARILFMTEITAKLKQNLELP